MILPLSNKFALAAAIVGALIVTGCDGAREAIGIGKQSPDEFAIVTRAPLSMPPDYGLRPPQPGVDRPQAVSYTHLTLPTIYSV